MGLRQEEVDEVVHLAMTVGASRLRVMADAELAAHPLETAPPAEQAFVAPAVTADSGG